MLSTGIIADKIEPSQNEVTHHEGMTLISLSCSYETSATEVAVYWYKQHPDQPPEFLLGKGARSATGEYIPNEHYGCTTSYTTTELQIKNLALADTALYYCALKHSDAKRANNCTKTVIRLKSFRLNQKV